MMVTTRASAARRLVASVLAFSLVLVAIVAVSPSAADAQVPVVGTADFRNAPQLAPGTYTDRIVTGDSAWYSLIYVNGTPYQFDVSFQGIAPSGVELTASFVAPTLTVVDGPAAVVTGNGASYPEGHTNEWFLKVELETNGQVGVEYPVSITVEGVLELGRTSCGDTPGCTLDEQYAALNVDLADAQAELEARGGGESAESVAAEIANLKGFAESAAALAPAAEGRLSRAEARMADLCSPDPICESFPDPGANTPIIGWLVGLAALLFGAYVGIKKLQGPGAQEDDTPVARPPASLANARSRLKNS